VKKIVISGGPHTGKTTLLEALRAELSDAYFVAEPAERVIARELKRAEEDAGYVPVLPWVDYPAFVPLVLEESVVLEGEIPAEAPVVFLDRSLIDNFEYYVINDFHDYDERTREMIDDAKYSMVLLCEPVGEFTKTEIRYEKDAQAAAELHEVTKKVFRDSGVQCVEVPPISVAERVELVKRLLAE
jgi:predicted ATPase